MGKYFSINELCNSKIAKRDGINNTPPANLIPSGELLISILDVIREAYGAPIIVNSGYRCKALNSHREIRGSSTSDHMLFRAADIKAGDNKKLWLVINNLIKEGKITFDQLIDERNLSWIHISIRDTGNRRMIFKA